MDHLQDRPFPLTPEGEGPGAWSHGSGDPGRRWLRRMLTLLGAACVAFSLTCLWLARQGQHSSAQNADSQAMEVVRAHFAALDRGDFRAAYSLFSSRLRREMPFQEFQDVMAAHLPLLQGKVSVFPQTTSARRVVVDIDFTGDRRMDLTAEFTLVRSQGRWWIDKIQWNLNRARLPRVTYT